MLRAASFEEQPSGQLRGIIPIILLVFYSVSFQRQIYRSRSGENTVGLSPTDIKDAPPLPKIYLDPYVKWFIK
jgi:hypothetical protein